ncbi:hypothetical protein B0T09DRAFT_348860 [Sordaria sp. MPI-SDFR-AT-0083]|nr:hypothetical protein B0T09DRAFT_348860 [Sordaria sp. MPI-SDFR-AT-0083]
MDIGKRLYSLLGVLRVLAMAYTSGYKNLLCFGDFIMSLFSLLALILCLAIYICLFAHPVLVTHSSSLRELAL